MTGVELYITPNGGLQAVPRHGGELWRTAFAAGAGHGLLALLRDDGAGDAESDGGAPSFHFFRRLAREFAVRVARASEPPFGADEAEWLAGLRPDMAYFAERVAALPPVTGSEYLDAERLAALYRELESAARQERAAAGTGWSEWLGKIHPAWSQVGKTAFHLAENPKDADGTHPFLFLATFVHRLSAADQPKHLPLGSALKQYAGNKAALTALLAPIQQAAHESAFLTELVESGRIFRPEAWSAAEAFRFLQDVPAFEAAGVVVRMSNLWKKAPRRLQAGVQMDLAPDAPSRVGVGQLLRFSVRAALNGEPLSPDEAALLLNSDGGLVRFKGEWVIAEPAKVARLLQEWQRAEALNAHTGIPLVHGLRLLAGVRTGKKGGAELPVTTAVLEDSCCSFGAVGALKEFLAAMREPQSIENVDVPETLLRVLRPYQLTGVRYLSRIARLGLGACLADDMGLGKTLQVLTFLASLPAQPLPALLVAPASLLRNWQLEAAKFVPGLRFGILHSSGGIPEWQKRLEENPEELLREFDLVATTYQMLPRLETLAQLEFPVVIADEAQAIKNPDTALSRAVRSLRGGCRLALTGTPVENHLTDLWSIFDFVLPGLLGTRTAFQGQVRTWSDPERGMDFTPLRELTAPYILRRLKSDKRIIADLPDKTEVKVFCRLTATQAVLYSKTVNQLAAELHGAEDIQRKGIVLAYLAQFKQICNHPAQFNGSGHYESALSGKFARLGEVVAEIATRQEKVLVFTQFREIIEPLHEHLTHCFGRPGLMLHGGTPVKKRAELVEQFQRDGGAPFFVLSLRAAGTGLNLTRANHVIHFDRWWNPAVENQATDRAYRIGQHRNVLAHKFITRGTLEEKIDALIEEKSHLAGQLFAAGTEALLTEASDAELLRLVRLEENLDHDEA